MGEVFFVPCVRPKIHLAILEYFVVRPIRSRRYFDFTVSYGTEVKMIALWTKVLQLTNQQIAPFLVKPNLEIAVCS